MQAHESVDARGVAQGAAALLVARELLLLVLLLPLPLLVLHLQPLELLLPLLFATVVLSDGAQDFGATQTK